ncbi:hypothetical protein [Nitrosomonas sp. Nm58]|uniref:hypothetical protein n=1 Tax=Nitrosomonas sp. Nm58 TaxID=200126 RepID=UPI0008959465|nr:hypothetical protein [Nitrosomonas sp. Nm58]SDZ14167.1 hypothetical protein SAMN05421754_10722 [Nitrosomonas sp. Nm58]
MAKRNDQVFQLSLTEIAFTVTFILLLLLGFIANREFNDKKIAEEKLAQLISIQEAEIALNEIKAVIEEQIVNVGSADVDKFILTLLDNKKIESERDALKKQVENLNVELSALTELRDHLSKATKLESSNVKEAIESALVLSSELRHQVKAQMNRDISVGDETKTLQELVEKAKQYDALEYSGVAVDQVKKENTDLKGQVIFLTNRLNARGGRDFPPCWADESTGKVQTLFALDLKSDTVEVKPGWPDVRANDAKMIPNVSEMISDSPMSYASFQKSVQSIFKQSKDLNCRHYVLLKSSISDATQSDRMRLMVENYFYKVEVRR